MRSAYDGQKGQMQLKANLPFPNRLFCPKVKEVGQGSNQQTFNPPDFSPGIISPNRAGLCLVRRMFTGNGRPFFGFPGIEIPGYLIGRPAGAGAENQFPGTSVPGSASIPRGFRHGIIFRCLVRRMFTASGRLFLGFPGIEIPGYRIGRPAGAGSDHPFPVVSATGSSPPIGRGSASFGRCLRPLAAWSGFEGFHLRGRIPPSEHFKQVLCFAKMYCPNSLVLGRRCGICSLLNSLSSIPGYRSLL
jgi:hypothetical protein